MLAPPYADQHADDNDRECPNNQRHVPTLSPMHYLSSCSRRKFRPLKTAPSLGGVTGAVFGNCAGAAPARNPERRNLRRFRSHSVYFQETEPGSYPLSPGREKPGAVMWTLVALVTATVLIPSIAIIGLFHLGILKRVEDFTPQADEWAASQDRKTRD
jgi:hypothetical protein